MPSYCVTLAVGLLHPGVDPADVLPSAADAARALTKVEAQDVGVVAGQARVTVRYLAIGDPGARRIAEAVLARTAELAQVSEARVSRRSGSRWLPLGAAPAASSR